MEFEPNSAEQKSEIPNTLDKLDTNVDSQLNFADVLLPGEKSPSNNCVAFKESDSSSIEITNPYCKNEEEAEDGNNEQERSSKEWTRAAALREKARADLKANKYDSAKDGFREALKIYRAELGNQPVENDKVAQDTIMRTLFECGESLTKHDESITLQESRPELEEADRMFDEALKIAKDIGANNHMKADLNRFKGFNLINLGASYYDNDKSVEEQIPEDLKIYRENYNTAIKVLTDGYKLLNTDIKADHPSAVAILGDLGLAEMGLSNKPNDELAKSSETHFAKAFDIAKKYANTNIANPELSSTEQMDRALFYNVLRYNRYPYILQANGHTNPEVIKLKNELLAKYPDFKDK